MLKADIVTAITAATSLSKQQASLVLESILSSITEAVKCDEKVTLVGFGHFVKRHRGHVLVVIRKQDNQ